MREIKFKVIKPFGEGSGMRDLQLWDGSLREDAQIKFIDPFAPTIMFTGFRDCKDQEIYEGDILAGKAMKDGQPEQCLRQVYWSMPTGQWLLDNTYKQDMTSGANLAAELESYAFTRVSNVYLKEEIRE